MSNFFFQISSCKIFEFGSKGTKGWGKLCWTDGTANFEIKFETKDPEIIACIQANRNAEVCFKASGTMTVNQGYGDYAGKMFQNYVLTNLKCVEETKKFDAKKFVENAFNQQNIVQND